ncbi:MAG: DUF285 domain-containing protein [Clostridia bacterium]|nr:DUF285 domain-containing protein [Clostridia bacterium]
MKSEKQKIKSAAKGITLIALVVTIVILIILVGIVINLILGENGILKRAKYAKDSYAKAQEEEQKELNELYLGIINEGEKITNDEVIYESDIWRAKKSTEKNTDSINIYFYSLYYDDSISLNEYKEQYFVNCFNERANTSYENFEDWVLNAYLNVALNANYNTIDEAIQDAEEYIKEYYEDYGITLTNITKQELIICVFELEPTQNYIDALLGFLGFTDEDIENIEKEYEECKDSQTITEIPEEIKNSTYTITYPDGSTEEILGSELNTYKYTYKVEENGDVIFKITKLEEETQLKVTVNNLRKTYKDEWYIYEWDRNTEGYHAVVIDNTLTTYGKFKSSINGVPVTNLKDTYYGCSNMTTLDLTGIDTSKVTDMSWMFNECSSLTNLDLRSFNTSKVTDMYAMFYECSSLTSIDLSNFNTSNVTDMISMFSGCEALTSIDLSNFDTSNVTDMIGMFSGCKALTSLDLSGFMEHRNL